MVLSNKEWLDKMDEIIAAIQNGGGDSQVIKDMLSNMWSSSVTYNVGDYALYNNKIWRCLVQNSNIAPSEGATWTSVKITSEISTLNSTIEQKTTTTIKTESGNCHLYKYGNIRVLQIYGMTYSSLKTVTLDTSDRPSNNHGFVGRAGSYGSAFFLLSNNGKIEGSYQQVYGGSYTELTDSMQVYATFVWVI